MITHIKGKLVEKSPTSVIIDVNGIGYLINISLNTFSAIPDQENLKLYTHLQIKEDSHTLFGFYGLKEREIFRLLISVSGIGASIARTMLSSLTPEQIIQGISIGDSVMIQSVKGIGLKTSQRVIIELKDKVLKIYDLDDKVSFPNSNTAKEEALSALEVLGFNRKQSEKAIAVILKDSPNETVELLIKKALKNL